MCARLAVSVLAALISWAFPVGYDQQRALGNAALGDTVRGSDDQRADRLDGRRDRYSDWRRLSRDERRGRRGSRSRRNRRGGGVLIPHRGDYVIEVSGYSTTSFTDAHGTLTIDLLNDCDDWTLQEKLDVVLEDAGKKNYRSNLLYRATEKASARRFNFAYSRDHLDIREDFIGDAVPVENGFLASFMEPRTSDLILPGETVYPITHRREIIAAARRGRDGFDMVVFDGGNDIAYLAKTQISKEIQADDGNPRVAATRAMLEKRRSHPLPTGRTWPVTTRYYPLGHGHAAPILVREFLLHESGIIVGLHFDYGDFQMDASLAHLDIFDLDTCSSRTRR